MALYAAALAVHKPPSAATAYRMMSSLMIERLVPKERLYNNKPLQKEAILCAPNPGRFAFLVRIATNIAFLTLLLVSLYHSCSYKVGCWVKGAVTQENRTWYRSTASWSCIGARLWFHQAIFSAGQKMKNARSDLIFWVGFREK